VQSASFERILTLLASLSALNAEGDDADVGLISPTENEAAFINATTNTTKGNK